jgi:hypothetical protein
MEHVGGTPDDEGVIPGHVADVVDGLHLHREIGGTQNVADPLGYADRRAVSARVGHQDGHAVLPRSDVMD